MISSEWREPHRLSPGIPDIDLIPRKDPLIGSKVQREFGGESYIGQVMKKEYVVDDAVEYYVIDYEDGDREMYIHTLPPIKATPIKKIPPSSSPRPQFSHTSR